MAKRKRPTVPTSDELDNQITQFHDVFALENVTQLREAVNQAVYGNMETNKPSEKDRAHTVEVLATLGQMGILTETDLDEAKKGYL